MKTRLDIVAVMKILSEDRDFADCNLSDLTLVGLDFSNANFMRANLSGTRLNGAILSGANLTAASLMGTTLIDADCTAAIFVDTHISRANFTSAKAIKANFSNANIFDTFFFGANLGSAIFNNTQLKNVRFDSATLNSQDRVDLTGASFDNAQCERVSFASSVLKKASMRNCHFGASNLLNTILSETDLEGADLRETSEFLFDNTYIRGVRLPRSPNDHWSRLRRAYSGPMLMFHVLLLTAFLLPYFGEILFWKSINQSQQLLSTLQDELEEIDKQLPPRTLPETALADLRAVWMLDGLDPTLLPVAVEIGIAALAATPKALRSETRRVKVEFERLWKERGLDPAALPRAGGIVPEHVANLGRRVQHSFRASEESLEQLWQARGMDPRLLPDVRAVVMANLIRAPDEIRAASLHRLSIAIRSIKPCGTARCEPPRPVWQLLLGFGHHDNWPRRVLSVLLIVYNLLRGILTYFVSILRDDEDRSGFSPGRSEYRPLYWAFWPMRILLLASLIAFLLHAWHYLFVMTVILPA